MFYFFVVISVESCEQNSKELEFSIVANWNLEERCNLSKMKDYSKDKPINFRIFYLSILPTKSNKQFQNNESEFSRFFSQENKFYTSILARLFVIVLFFHQKQSDWLRKL